MIQLVRGDWDKLLGRGLIYAQLTDEFVVKQIGTEFPGVYLSNNLDDFVKKMGIERDKQGIEELKKRIEGDIKDKFTSNTSRGFACYMGEYGLRDKKQIYSGDNDVIFAGKWKNIINLEQTIRSFLDLYLRRYAEIRQDGMESTLPSLSLLGSEHYAEYSGKPIKELILNYYVRPIMDAAKQGRTEIVREKSINLTNFVEGSLFVKQTLAIIELAKIASGEHQKDLINDYLSQIDAIRFEDLEEARRLEIEIKRKIGIR